MNVLEDRPEHSGYPSARCRIFYDRIQFGAKAQRAILLIGYHNRITIIACPKTLICTELPYGGSFRERPSLWLMSETGVVDGSPRLRDNPVDESESRAGSRLRARAPELHKSWRG